MFFALVTGFYIEASQSDTCKQRIIDLLYSIPEKDRQEIEDLFSYLFKYQAFAYSLYGDKPITFSDQILTGFSSDQCLKFLSLQEYCQEKLEPYCEPEISLNQKWETWKKYRYLFNLKNYFLTDKILTNKSRIFLINKKYFLQVFTQNVDLFNQVLGQEISPEDLLNKIIWSKVSLFNLLNNNEGLLGILLGFGRHNAMLFQEREDLTDQLEINKCIILKHLSPVQKKLEWVEEKLQPFREHDPYIISSINRVCFAADPSHYETHLLRSKYDELNKKINEIYFKDDWFEQTLIQLTAD